MAQPTQATPAPTAFVPVSQVSVKMLLGLTAAVTLFYFLFSFASQGFYQQDEANHFTSMLRFWHDPNSVLGNWAKPGYKVIYALPALLGQGFVTFVNALFAGFTCFFVAQAARLQGRANPVLAFAIMATLPLWMALAFRNYSEIPSAFMLAVALYGHYARRYWLAAILIGYVCTIRQEFYPVAVVYFGWLAMRRQVLPALLLGLAPLLQNLWGYSASGDPLYLLTSITGTSSAIADLYPRQGFDHYFKTSMVIYGPAAVLLMVVYLSIGFQDKKKLEWAPLVAFWGYFLINCLINFQGRAIGPSTGGNLRYLLVVAPALALIAADAVQLFNELPNGRRFRLALPVIGLALLTLIFLNYKHNFIKLQDERDPKPFLGLVLFTVLLYFTANRKDQVAWLSGGLVILALMNVRPVPLAAEDKACKQLADWFKNDGTLKGRPMLVEHPMFYYYTGTTEYDYAPKAKPVIKPNIDSAAKGTIIIWDSHYTFRPNRRKEDVNYDYFENQPQQFRRLQQFVSDDQGFGAMVYEKL